MAFPEYIQGECSRCGSGQETAPDPVNAAVTRTDIIPLQLKLFRGMYLCESCINDIKSDEQSENDAAKHNEAELFRAKIGFRNNPT